MDARQPGNGAGARPLLAGDGVHSTPALPASRAFAPIGDA